MLALCAGWLAWSVWPRRPTTIVQRNAVAIPVSAMDTLVQEHTGKPIEPADQRPL